MNDIERRASIIKTIPEYYLSPQHVRNAKVVPDRNYMLSCLPKGMRAAELGVAEGNFSQKILELLSPKELNLVDLWIGERYGKYHDLVKEKMKDYLQDNTVIIHRMNSLDYLKCCESQSLDFIYIDTDHSYRVTYNELIQSERVISQDGFIAGHDFTAGNIVTPVIYGVQQAVNKFCVEKNFEIVFITVEPHGYNSFCLKRI